MNTVLILILSIPLIEIYLFIKIGSQIGALNTIALILITAIVGVAYARYEGFNTLKSGMSQLMRNEVPIYEIISGATLTFAALLLILPGFATDFLGVLLVFPLTRKLIIQSFSKNFKSKKDKENYSKYRNEFDLASNFKKIQKFPLHIDLEIDNLCNFECSFCPIGQPESKFHEQYKTIKTIEKDKVYSLLDECKLIGVKSVQFS